MRCSNCHTDNREGRRFCAECGLALVISCPACGSVNEPGERFCGECGTALSAPQTSSAPTAAISERRVTSILFADLVGFTTLSEQRDPEDVRELLAGYFDTASGIVARYGGTLEKFIGDAVVAVWGTPIALEDDAERAVRAALDLVSAVAQLGDDANGTLHLRAAVSTGETAVTIGALGQGMVAGDVVNTTARMQSAAEPGSVLIDEATRRATEAAIEISPAGSFTLKGKAEPVELWTALRVVAGRRGEGRSAGLEPPFVGRDREFRLIKEAAVATGEEGRAQLVSIVGIAGIGKSRLAWEFEKHSDGLVREIWWHQGRCLSYGDGVAFWALAEMVRVRARITEDESEQSMAAKLAETVAQFVPDAEERDWIIPALGNLLGIDESVEGDRGRLFSGWRLFFERMADSGPTVLVFEDIQWADQALLDFIEYLMEWSRDHPLLVVTLARPELFDRRAGWGVGSRAFTSLTLEPLAPETMRDLVDGMAPGLPDSLVRQIVDRAEGVPLYAVETVRMLLDRGVLERRDGQMVAIGEVESLEIPETLHALTAARLDALGESERKLVQDAAVLGKTFQVEGLAAVSGLGAAQLEPLLDALRRKEIFSVTEDPRSPEQGQYGFVQELLRTVAYETLGRRDRKARHLATARHLESLPAGDELIEVIAAHQLDAYRAMPDNCDDVRDIARESLLRAAQRAASLAAKAEAMRLVLQAVELTDSDRDRAELQQRAAQLALAAGLVEECEALAGEAIALLESDGDPTAAASAHVVRAEARFLLQRPDEAVAEMEDAYAVMSSQPPDAEFANLAAQLGRMRMFISGAEPPLDPIERAIEVAEALRLPWPLSHALNTKGVLLMNTRPEEARSLLEGALRIATENDEPEATLRAYFNLAFVAGCWGHPSVEFDRAGLTLARRLGERQWERSFLMHQAGAAYRSGDWDRAVELVHELLDSTDGHDAFVEASSAYPLACILGHRGEITAARQALADSGGSETSPDIQGRAMWTASAAALAIDEGDLTAAVRLARIAYELGPALGSVHNAVVWGTVMYARNLLAMGELAEARRVLEGIEAVPVGLRPPELQATRAMLRARLGFEDEDAESGEAIAIFRRLGHVWELAIMLEAHGVSLESRGRPGSAELAEAREIYVHLGAAPAIARIDATIAATAARSA